VRHEERLVKRKKPGRKAEPPTKRGIAWPRWTGFRGMTLRDWLPIVGAFLIPVVIALGTWLITLQQAKIENQRAQAERELAEKRAQDEALQAYLDQMSTLVLEDLNDPGIRTLMRARTLTALRRLDPSRKEVVMQFLLEAELLHSFTYADPIIELNNAELNGVNLNGANLSGADLESADLSDADLSDAALSEAGLRIADLTNANLQSVAAISSGFELEAKSLEGATMPNGQKYEDWLKSKGSGEE
jgi:Pentapeptide repeats (8 copies)